RESAVAEAYRAKRAPFGSAAVPMERYLTAIEHVRRMPSYTTGVWTRARLTAPTPAPLGGEFTAIAQSHAGPAHILAGTAAGWIYRLDRPGSRPVQPRHGYVAAIAFDPTNAEIAYVTYSSFNDSSKDAHIYKSLDSGNTWMPIDGNGTAAIPDIPVHAIAVDPVNRSRLWAGTDLGVFTTLDRGRTWLRENKGFDGPTEFLAIEYGPGGTRLFAYPHGSGAWSVMPGWQAVAATAPPGNPDEIAGATLLDA